jgi:hypothetical protein
LFRILLVVGLAACAACTGGGPGGDRGGEGPGSSAAGATDWTPAPVTRAGLSALTTVDGDRLSLHTASGPKHFLTGVNLGSTTPTHQPGELAITARDYRRWFAGMGRLGVRVVRIYTIHPPAFYTELAAYNRAHPQAPLYLVQGVYLPDESYLDGGTLYDPAADEGFSRELVDASAAVHGDLHRTPRPGHASGTWRADVSRWLAAWIVGVEWDPEATDRTDRAHPDAPAVHGRYFRSTAEATPTERWLAAHLEELATVEARAGTSVPIAFANWPTTDPLVHPAEPLPKEDLAGVDANHVVATDAWPGGTFASYHAYPYYPDFLRYEGRLAGTRWAGREDRYAGYLVTLREHHAGMPVIISEVGVPSSLGSAHQGTLGRDQGHHREREAMAMDADLVRLVHGQGLAGAFVFSWTDEWFKRTWNTMEHQAPAERRQLWHDPLTNEQYFGIVATDPEPLPDSALELAPEGSAIDYLLLRADASYLYADVTFSGDPPAWLRIDIDTVPGPETSDYRIQLEPARHRAHAFVRAALDPIRLDTPVAHYQPDVGKPWHLYRLLTNRSLVVNGERLPAEFLDVGELVEGTWDPADSDYDSLATWNLLRHGGGDSEPETTIRLRLPWAMLGLSDPSSRTALGEGTPASTVRIPGLTLRLSTADDGADDGADDADEPGNGPGNGPLRVTYSWPTWNSTGYTERLKRGADRLARAFAELNP